MEPKSESSPKPESKPEPTYSEFLKSLHLDTIYLKFGKAHLFELPTVPEEVRFTHQGYIPTYELIAPDQLLCTVHDESTGNFVNKSDPVCHVETKFFLTFSSDRPFSEFKDEYLEHFVRSNVRVTAHPYIREYMQASLARVGIPWATMPLLACTKDAGPESQI